MEKSAGAPVYLSVREVARLMRWKYHRAYVLLQDAKLLVDVGGHPLVPTERLREIMPDLWDKFRQQLL